MKPGAKQEEMSQFRVRATNAWVIGGVVVTLSYGVAFLLMYVGRDVPLLLFPIGLGPFFFPFHIAAVFLTRETPFASKWKAWAHAINIVGALVSLVLIVIVVLLPLTLISD